MTAQQELFWPGARAEELLRELATWGHTTTIVIHGGSVFEFKGPFPEGTMAEGHYNLHGPTPGFHGHLRLDRIRRIRLQEKTHRGRSSYAFCFENDADESIFKVFLGRDAQGQLIAEQLQAYERLKDQAISLAVLHTLSTLAPTESAP